MAPFVEGAKLIANNPVAAAIYYNTVIDAFTQFLLGYKQPGGVVSDTLQHTMA